MSIACRAGAGPAVAAPVVEWGSGAAHRPPVPSVRVLELRLRAEPVLRTHDREVVAARFVEPRALLAEPVLPPFIRAYLGERRADDPRPLAGA